MNTNIIQWLPVSWERTAEAIVPCFQKYSCCVSSFECVGTQQHSKLQAPTTFDRPSIQTFICILFSFLLDYHFFTSAKYGWFIFTNGAPFNMRTKTQTTSTTLEPTTANFIFARICLFDCQSTWKPCCRKKSIRPSLRENICLRFRFSSSACVTAKRHYTRKRKRSLQRHAIYQ